MSHVKTAMIILVIFTLIGPAIPLPAAALLEGKFEIIGKVILGYPMGLMFGWPIALITGVGFVLVFFAIGQLSKSLKTNWSRVSLVTTGLVLGWLVLYGAFFSQFGNFRKFQESMRVWSPDCQISS